MTSLAPRKLSHSICRNRWEQFATLYDPDAEQVAEDPQVNRTPPPKATRDPETRSVHIFLSHTRYAPYKERRLANNPHCAYCGDKVDNNKSNLDHVLPQCRGGDDWPANILLTCKDCNTKKADMTLPEWVEELRRWQERFRRIEAKVLEMIEEGADCYPPVRARGERAPKPGQTFPKRDKIADVKRHDFGAGKRRFMILRRNTGEVVMRDVDLKTATQHLMATGDNPDDPLRLLGYQELFNPLFHVPDWRRPEDLAAELQPEE